MTTLGQKLIDSIRAKAAENPDFVYQSPFGEDDISQDNDRLYGSCVYVYNGCPSCLIGHALFDNGLIDASLEDRNDNHVPISKFLKVLDVNLDPEERLWLRAVQHEQDTHATWAEAVAYADNKAKDGFTPTYWDRLVA